MEILLMIISIISLMFGLSQFNARSNADDEAFALRLLLQQVQAEKLNQSHRLNAEIRALELLINKEPLI